MNERIRQSITRLEQVAHNDQLDYIVRPLIDRLAKGLPDSATPKDIVKFMTAIPEDFRASVLFGAFLESRPVNNSSPEALKGTLKTVFNWSNPTVDPDIAQLRSMYGASADNLNYWKLFVGAGRNADNGRERFDLWQTEWEQIPKMPHAPTLEQQVEAESQIDHLQGGLRGLSRIKEAIEQEVDGLQRGRSSIQRLFYSSEFFQQDGRLAGSIDVAMQQQDRARLIREKYPLISNNPDFKDVLDYYPLVLGQHPNTLVRCINRMTGYEGPTNTDRVDLEALREQFKKTIAIIPSQDRLSEWTSYKNPSFRKWADGITSFTDTEKLRNYVDIPLSIMGAIEKHLNFEIFSYQELGLGIDQFPLLTRIKETMLVYLFGDRVE